MVYKGYFSFYNQIHSFSFKVVVAKQQGRGLHWLFDEVIKINIVIGGSLHMHSLPVTHWQQTVYPRIPESE